MKKILISLCCLFCVSIHAQPPKFTKNLDAYVGTWEFKNDTMTFRIYLKKGKSYYRKGGPLSHEMVYGGHYIERNGVVITDLKEAVNRATDDTRTANGMTIVASNSQFEESQVNPNMLTFVFSDKLKDKTANGQLTLQTNAIVPQLRWQILRMSERVSIWVRGIDPEPVVLEGWTVPENVILTKVGVAPPPLPPEDPNEETGPGEGEELISENEAEP